MKIAHMPINARFQVSPFMANVLNQDLLLASVPELCVILAGSRFVTGTVSRHAVNQFRHSIKVEFSEVIQGILRLERSPQAQEGSY